MIAPSFATTVKRIAKYVQVELQLLEYQAIQDANGEKGLVLREVEFGQPADPPSVGTIENILKYFDDDAVKEVFNAARNALAARNVEVRPLTNEWMSLWYNGKRFAYLGAKKKFFVAKIMTLEGTRSGRQRISTHEGWKAFCDNFMQPVLQQLEGAN